MSLTRGFARLVLLVGHASQSVNNAHAAGLDCGACCGQSGEVNSRAVASLLNDPRVRDGLAQRGIKVPSSTRFVPGLHNTTTDEVYLFDLDELLPESRDALERTREWLEAAGARARAERAGQLKIEAASSTALRDRFFERASSWSEPRPEWGLTGNAAFVVAPRERCRDVDFRGRAFLHEYRAWEDPEHAVLEQIMTAPMIVTHWINLQYYASTVDNRRFGSGNKVLHNVVGGHVGVLEGNAGDLRIGLPMQSLHDGARWVHTPLRLSVYIAAPRDAIAAIVRKHEVVRQLVENEWLYLFQLDDEDGGVHRYRGGAWTVASG